MVTKRASAFDIIKAINSIQQDHIAPHARQNRAEMTAAPKSKTLAADPQADIAALLAQAPQVVQALDSLSTALKPKLAKIETDIPPSPVASNNDNEYFCEKPEEIEPTLRLLAKAKAAMDRVLPPAIAAERAAQTIPNDQKRAILMTGANGTLGCHTMQHLADSGGADAVYCLVRAKNPAEAEQRMEEALKVRALSTLAEMRATGLVITFHPVNYEASQLGLSDALMNELRANVNTVLHFAWSVRHIAPIHKFNDNIVSIIQLARSFPLSRHYFTSSVSTILAWFPPNGGAPEELTPDVRTAWTGYGRSKWIAEHLYAHAATLGLDATIIRSTQLVGDRKLGLWSGKDTIAVMLRSGPHLGALPDRDLIGRQVSWLPIDQAGWACAMIASPFRPRKPGFEFFNLGANTLYPWEKVVDVLRRPENFGPLFDVQEYDTYAEKTRTPTSPTLKYARMFDHFKSPPRERYLAVPKLQKALEAALQARGFGADTAHAEVNDRLRGVDEELVGKMARYWRTEGLVPKPAVAARL